MLAIEDGIYPPETVEAVQFGSPVRKVVKKTFVCNQHAYGRFQLQFLVGVEHQAMYTSDSRYSIPKYVGHNGWINLDVEDKANWCEIDPLLMNGYWHFALKRMIQALEGV